MSGISEENRQPDTKIRCIDLTPQRMKCSYGASCPGVFGLEPQDLTPEHLRCAIQSSCPAVVAHAGDLVIIGKRAGDLAAQLGKGVGPDEYAIVISPDYFENVKCQANAAETGTDSAPSAFQFDVSSSAIFRAIAVPMQLKDFGRWEVDPDHPDNREKDVFVASPAHIERFIAACNEAVTRVLDLFSTLEPRPVNEGIAPVPSLRSSVERSAEAFNAGLAAAAKHITKLRWMQGTFPTRAVWTREEAWAAIALALESAAADLETLKATNSPRRIEEARSADERTAQTADASLTPNTPQEPHSASLAGEDVSPAVQWPGDDNG